MYWKEILNLYQGFVMQEATYRPSQKPKIHLVCEQQLPFVLSGMQNGVAEQFGQQAQLPCNWEKIDQMTHSSHKHIKEKILPKTKEKINGNLHNHKES